MSEETKVYKGKCVLSRHNTVFYLINQESLELEKINCLFLRDEGKCVSKEGLNNQRCGHLYERRVGIIR